jgi:hypothetical protein
MGQTLHVDAEQIATIQRMLARHERRVEAVIPTELMGAWFGAFAAGQDLGHEAGLARQAVAEAMAEIGAALAGQHARLRRLRDEVTSIDVDAASSLRRLGV